MIVDDEMNIVCEVKEVEVESVVRLWSRKNVELEECFKESFFTYFSDVRLLGKLLLEVREKIAFKDASTLIVESEHIVVYFFFKLVEEDREEELRYTGACMIENSHKQ